MVVFELNLNFFSSALCLQLITLCYHCLKIIAIKELNSSDLRSINIGASNQNRLSLKNVDISKIVFLYL